MPGGGAQRFLSGAQGRLDKHSQLIAALGGAALVALVAVTVVAVFWRYILNSPIFGIEDVSTMTLTVVVAASVAYGAHKQAHVGVNIIGFAFSRRVTRVTDLAARTLTFAIAAIAGYALFAKGSCGLPCGHITSNLAIPHPPFYFVLGAAMLSYAAVLLFQIAVGIANWTGEDPNEMRG